jgi:hypothetical protein
LIIHSTSFLIPEEKSRYYVEMKLQKFDLNSVFFKY